MAADYTIHIRTDEVTEEILNRLYRNVMGHPREKEDPFDQEEWEKDPIEMGKHYDIVYNTPHYVVGEVSWLKAAIFDDDEAFIPDPIGRISELIGEDVKLIDQELIEGVRTAMLLPNQTGYTLNDGDGLVLFLSEHIGKECFAVSW